MLELLPVPSGGLLDAVCQNSHNTRVMNPGIVTIRRMFGMRCANTRTAWDKWGIFRELPPLKRGIHRGRGFHRELPTHLL
jgi:hypothetical protein